MVNFVRREEVNGAEHVRGRAGACEHSGGFIALKPTVPELGWIRFLTCLGVPLFLFPCHVLSGFSSLQEHVVNTKEGSAGPGRALPPLTITCGMGDGSMGTS